MKRSYMITMLSNIIKNRNTGHYSYNEKEHAEEVLRFMENVGILKPTHKKKITRRDIELMPYEELVVADGWDDE